MHRFEIFAFTKRELGVIQGHWKYAIRLIV